MAKKKKKDEEVTFDENSQVDVTVEQLKEGEKKERKVSRRTILRKEILEFLVDHTDELPDILAKKVKELKTLPTRVGAGEGKPSIAKQLKEMILEKKEIHEDVFYNTFKLGRLEMKRRFYNMRKKVAEPKDAVYVSFDPDSGIYKLEGEGEVLPEGFDN